MTPLAITFLVITLVIIWGGLIGSTLMLSRRPEISEYPAGDDDAEVHAS